MTALRKIVILCAAMIAAGVISSPAEAQHTGGSGRSYLPMADVTLIQYYSRSNRRSDHRKNIYPRGRVNPRLLGKSIYKDWNR